jgi:hypothetical protein
MDTWGVGASPIMRATGSDLTAVTWLHGRVVGSLLAGWLGGWVAERLRACALRRLEVGAEESRLCDCVCGIREVEFEVPAECEGVRWAAVNDGRVRWGPGRNRQFCGLIVLSAA